MLELSRNFKGAGWQWNICDAHLRPIYGDGRIIAIERGDLRYEKIGERASPDLGAVFEYGETTITIRDDHYLREKQAGSWQQYDLEGRLTLIGHKSAAIARYEYTGDSKAPDRITSPDGSVLYMAFTYTADGRPATATARGRTVRYEYENGRLARFIDPAERIAHYQYRADGKMTAKQTPEGDYRMTYSASGDLTSLLDASGAGKFFTYDWDASRRVYYSKVETSGGQVHERWFDRYGELIEEAINGVPVQQIQLDGRNEIVTDEAGASTQMVYDDRGNMIKEIRPDGGIRTYEYEPVYQQLTREVNTQGLITRTLYDANGYPRERIEAEGTPLQRSTHYQYNALGQLLEMTDPLGHRMAYEYNAWGDLTRQYDPDNPAYQTTYEYDERGFRSAMVDALGRRTEYLHDALGRLLIETDPLGQQTIRTYEGDNVVELETGRTASQSGRITRYVYDDVDRLLQTIRVDADGSEQIVSTNAYDSAGRLISRTNALGQATSYTYDAHGNPDEQRVPYTGGESVTRTIYNDQNQMIEQIDPLGVRTITEYDYLDRPYRIIEAAGTEVERITTNTYDTEGRVIATTRQSGGETLLTQTTYDLLGRVIATHGDRIHAMSFEYNVRDELIAQINGEGERTEFAYDAYGRRTLTRTGFDNPSGVTEVQVNYDLAGQVLSTIDGEGHHTHYAYDALGRQTAESFPLNPQQTVPPNWWTDWNWTRSAATYNTWGQVIEARDAAGAVVTAVYDDFGRKIQETNATGLTVTLVYNALDQVVAVQYPPVSTDDTGQATQQTYQYDPLNSSLLLAVTDRAGNTTQYTYDARFQQATQTSSMGATTHFAYDALGRRIAVTDQLGQRTETFYHQSNDVIAIIHPDHEEGVKERITHYEYNAAGDRIREYGAGVYPIQYTYDNAGRLVAMTDGNGSLTQWTYNSLNLVTQKTYADGTAHTYQYDRNGRLLSRLDANSQLTQYGYNAYGQVLTIDYPTDTDVAFTYDPMGRRTTMTDATGVTAWSYDAAGQLLEYRQNGVDRELTYQYDAEGNRIRRMVDSMSAPQPAPWETIYNYDAAGRLELLLDKQVSIDTPFRYQWRTDASLIAEIETPSGAKTVRTHDVLGRLEATRGYKASGELLNEFVYTLDAASQRTAERSTNGTRQFEYDETRQLIEARKYQGADTTSTPSQSYAYDYDPIGNRESAQTETGVTTYDANNVNQYTAITQSGATDIPTHDLNGNMTQVGDLVLGYDEENRLTHVAKTTPGNLQESIFVYDGLSRRVERREYVNGTLTEVVRYLYDGLLPIQELDETGQVIRSLTRGLDLTQTMQRAGGVGGLLATTEGGASYSYFYDGNGNVTDLHSEITHTVSAHYEYDPFGRRLTATGTLAHQPYQWSTKEHHEASGLVYYLYRFYSPEVGRWVNRDPIEEQGGVNLYDFVGNGGPNRFDYFGLKIHVMGHETWHQYHRDYAGRVSDGTEAFADTVMQNLQAGVSNNEVTCLLLSKDRVANGPYTKYWTIRYTRGPDFNSDECRNCPNVKRLMDAINDNQAIQVYNTDFSGLNSFMHNIPIGKNPNIHWDPNARVPLPTVREDGGLGPRLPTPPDAILWHEVIGHGGEYIADRPYGHPQNSSNVIGSETPVNDPIIEIENEYRRWRNYPERYPQYYLPGTTFDDPS